MTLTHQKPVCSDELRKQTQQIFALRKQDGCLDEALLLARAVYATNSTDPWVVKALGWTLYDCIKRAQKAEKLGDVKRFETEIRNLNITADTDEILFKQFEFILKTLSPELKALAEAKKLSKKGQHLAAADIYRKIVKNNPDNAEAKTNTGWELYRLLKVQSGLQQTVALLREYASLKFNTKPSVLHSLFLSESCKLSEDWSDFYKFVKWWKIELLRPEDWKDRFNKDGSISYPPLASTLVTSLYKNAKKFHKRGPEHKWILLFVRKVAETTDSDWAPYYLAKMTVWFEGDLTGIKDLLIPLIRTKQREFWAWQTLAECSTDPEEKLNFYARSVVTTAGIDDFKVELYHQFALFLAQANQHTLASLVVNRYLAIQNKKKKQIPSDITALQRAPWFESQTKDDLNERLMSAAEEANRFLFKDLPWTSANFIEVLESKDGRPPLTILLIADKGSCKTRNRSSALERPDRGAPIRAKLFWPSVNKTPPKPGEPPHGTPLAEIYAWELRQDGTPYDCAKKRVGVVSQTNEEKRFARVSLNEKLFGLLHFDTFPDSRQLQLGDVVIIWATDILSGNKDSVRILNFRKKSKCSVDGLYCAFKGSINIRNGNAFGFVKDTVDIFVSPHLVSAHHLVDQVLIKGWAVCQWNKKKGKPSWNVLTIDI
jgi:hypothetical protein